jgi:16S rRNA (cytosine1402-N4)-methyltransferase
MSESGHQPVLLEETLELLSPQPGETVVDCTLGRGGHAMALASEIGPAGTLVGFDLDPANLVFVEQRLADSSAPNDPSLNTGGSTAEGRPPTAPRTILIHDNFASTTRHLTERGLTANIVLADLGFSSTQMDDPARGFSFAADGPLDMRLNPQSSVSAADLVNTLSERELADLIFHTGEDPLARKIARKLVEERRESPIRTTARLAATVVAAYGPKARASRMHPATRTFMALRIAVNDELAALRALMESITRAAEQMSDEGEARYGGQSWLADGARIGVISFHSLEDRIVKQCFADIERRSLGRRLSRKPVVAREEEIGQNPRARSAKLRVARIGDPMENKS